ncbi:MAG: hypothetical protein JMDDDDMK_02802 [Acidobacteria bacterium]|nr:hypothetical protein [Acidobacteriota bacterium]
MRLGAGQAAARAANRNLESVDEIAGYGRNRFVGVSRIFGSVGLSRLLGFFAYRRAVERHLFGMVIERHRVIRKDRQPDVPIGSFVLRRVGRGVNGADVNGNRFDPGIADGDRVEQPINDREHAAAANRPRIASARDGFDAQALSRLVRNHRQAGAGVNDES